MVIFTVGVEQCLNSIIFKQNKKISPSQQYTELAIVKAKVSPILMKDIPYKLCLIITYCYITANKEKHLSKRLGSVSHRVNLLCI